MVWHDDPRHPFAGIAEKLKRSNQNIVNLESEIRAFFQSGKYPVIPYPTDEAWQEAVDYHRSKPIPLRFGVLCGEVVHHLRSCLDHVVWHFSDSHTRNTSASAIEFPIFENKPAKKSEIERYERKIQGIANAKVRSLIEDAQPYKVGTDAANHLLLIIHDMDRFDKHRELVIVDSSAAISFPPTMDELWIKASLYTQGKLPRNEHLSLSRALKKYAKVSVGVSFREFGNRKTQPVIPALKELHNATVKLMGLFAAEV